MLFLLVWVPVGTSLVLGVVYLLYGDARPAFKILGAVIFFFAVYLQFFSSHSLFGMLLQITLALYLAMWLRMRG